MLFGKFSHRTHHFFPEYFWSPQHRVKKTHFGMFCIGKSEIGCKDPKNRVFTVFSTCSGYFWFAFPLILHVLCPSLFRLKIMLLLLCVPSSLARTVSKTHMFVFSSYFRVLSNRYYIRFIILFCCKFFYHNFLYHIFEILNIFIIFYIIFHEDQHDFFMEFNNFSLVSVR